MMTLFDQIGDRSDRDYMQKASALAESYIPLNAERMLSMVQGGTVTTNIDSGSGFVNPTFHDMRFRAISCWSLVIRRH